MYEHHYKIIGVISFFWLSLSTIGKIFDYKDTLMIILFASGLAGIGLILGAIADLLNKRNIK